MPASVGYLIIDTTDPQRLTSFWSELLGVGVETTIGDGQFVVLSKTEDGLTVGFQQVPDAKSGKNRLHLDLIMDDLETAIAEIEALGGRWLEPGQTRELEGFRWRLMADADGNEFDIDVLPPEAGAGQGL
ncbi:MAG: VOC family protein [Streptosporangiaceae bacterium]